MSYTKLDSGLTDSTIWQAPDATRIVWITMLSMADQNGYIGASMPGLAGRARVPLEACIKAIETLLAPDEWSRTRDHDGRRIAEAEGGWVLLNHAKYRAKQSADDRRERSRLAMADLRARRKAAVNSDSQLTGVNLRESKLLQAEAEADAQALHSNPSSVIAAHSVADAPVKTPKKQGTRLSTDWQLPLAWGQWAQSAYPHWPVDTVREIAQRFKDHWTAKTGRDSTKLDWEATWRNWCKSDITQRQFPPPAGINGNGSSETPYQRGKRERVDELTGGLAARVIAPVVPAALTLDLEPSNGRRHDDRP